MHVYIAYSSSLTDPHTIRASIVPGLPPTLLMNRMRSSSVAGTQVWAYPTAPNRLATLLLWIGPDATIDPYPSVAIPFNMDYVFGTGVTNIMVGITSATGTRYAQQEILSWKMCSRSQSSLTYLATCS